MHLDYEAYGAMAEEKMAQIAREIWARWPEVRGVALVQRIGRLGVGENTTFVACAGAHRDSEFEHTCTAEETLQIVGVVETTGTSGVGVVGLLGQRMGAIP